MTMPVAPPNPCSKRATREWDDRGRDPHRTPRRAEEQEAGEQRTAPSPDVAQLTKYHLAECEPHEVQRDR